MTRSQKIGISVLVIVTMAVGYAVYWWHEGVLDEQALASEPSEGAVEVAEEVHKLLLATDFRDKATGLLRLENLSTSERAEVLAVLADDTESPVRLVVMPLIGKLKDRYPAMRAVLARVVVSDPDRDVKEAAKAALGGGAR